MIKVLVVEDDPMVGKLHEVYLNQLDGFKLVDIVRTGSDALKLLAQKSYDLAILDVFMPGMDGLDVLKEIRAQNYDIDVIMITAATDKAHIATALRYGAVDFLIKPFEFERFSLALNMFKQRYNILNDATTIKQEEIDTMLVNKASEQTGKIPKGLEKNTLHDVWQVIVQTEDTFTTEEISEKVGISRVSIRKYLEFLKTLNILHLELNRGCVGRPVYKYKCINKNPNIINSYIK